MKRPVICSALFLLLLAASLRAEKPIATGLGLGTSRLARRTEGHAGNVVLRSSVAAIQRSADGGPRPGRSSRPTAAAAARIHEVVWTLEQPAACQQRSVPQRLLARLGGKSRLLSVALERRDSAVDRWGRHSCLPYHVLLARFLGRQECLPHLLMQVATSTSPPHAASQ